MHWYDHEAEYLAAIRDVFQEALVEVYTRLVEAAIHDPGSLTSDEIALLEEWVDKSPIEKKST